MTILGRDFSMNRITDSRKAANGRFQCMILEILATNKLGCCYLLE